MPVRRNIKTSPNRHFDCLILGAGPVGAIAALLLANQGLCVGIIDRQDPQSVLKPGFDGRTTALSYGSQEILNRAGIWQDLDKKSEPILEIEVIDGHGPVHLDFGDAETKGAAMGHIVLNLDLRRALFQALQNHDNITLYAPADVAAMRAEDSMAQIDLSDGKKLSAQLLIAADGRGSKARAGWNIPTRQYDYRHHAVIATLIHEKPHHNVAYECFLTSGPLALLPMQSINGKYASSLVWSESPEKAEALMDLSNEEFCDILQDRFGDYLGEFALACGRQKYPLNLIIAKKVYGQRMVLIGDAAHGIHPIAGQGLNLGLRDTLALSESLSRAKKLGLDIGSKTVLKNYAKAREFDTTSMITATHGLNWLFGVDHAAMRGIRGIGLKLVDYIPPLKRAFVRRAMGDF